MLLHGGNHGDFARTYAQGGHQVHRIPFGTAGGTQSRHRNAQDAVPRPSQLVESQGRHQQGQGAVQTAGNPDHRRPATDVLQAGNQPRHLDGKHLTGTPVDLPCVPVRDEGMRVHGPIQFFLEVGLGALPQIDP